jgi:hypothetical protein
MVSEGRSPGETRPAAGSGWAARPDKETRLSEQRKYRSWTAQQQKIEIVLAGLRGDRTVSYYPTEPSIWI